MGQTSGFFYDIRWGYFDSGNQFIGIQPPRESEEKAEEIYHSMEHPCPHQYLGYYHWLKEEFGADILYHVGAHGTAEWLPGKAVGLSASCYPFIALEGFAHVYPYIMNLPGEGTQAKRRTSAVLVSHMVPAMRESGLYGAMETLNEKLEQYDNAVQYARDQIKGLLEDIWNLASDTLHMLDGVQKADFYSEPDSYMGKLHSTLEEVRHSQIRDGLHILGKIPEGERYSHLLEFMEIGGGSRKELEAQIEKIPEELQSVAASFRGEFIRPGASGCPSRGAYEALPTGRNFYGVHPFCIPTKEAWKSGKEMAEKLLARMQKDTGQMPEAVTLVVYSGETMKTYGTAIAQALYLYGITPKWFDKSDRVSALEVIPREKLNHPRVDVTLRVSGLFRDNFPNLTGLLDEAVNLAAAEEEPEDFNYVRKHMMRDIKKYAEQGLGREQAKLQASARIFSCPPGQYGAGIGLLLSGGKWKERKELGDAYLSWSGFAYGGGRDGMRIPGAFSDRLKDSQAVIKNLSSVEEDLMDSDDFYNYYGGAVAASESLKGSAAASYTLSSADGKEFQIRTTKEELDRLVRAKVLNPAWIEGLREHGFRGAQEMSAMFDMAFGWDASTGSIEDWVYDGLTRTYLADEALRQWIAGQNIWALRHMSERLLEANGRGMWNASDEDLQLVREIYLDMEGSLEELG